MVCSNSIIVSVLPPFLIVLAPPVAREGDSAIFMGSTAALRPAKSCRGDTAPGITKDSEVPENKGRVPNATSEKEQNEQARTRANFAGESQSYELIWRCERRSWTREGTLPNRSSSWKKHCSLWHDNSVQKAVKPRADAGSNGPRQLSLSLRGSAPVGRAMAAWPIHAVEERIWLPGMTMPTLSLPSCAISLVYVSASNRPWRTLKVSPEHFDTRFLLPFHFAVQREWRRENERFPRREFQNDSPHLTTP